MAATERATERPGQFAALHLSLRYAVCLRQRMEEMKQNEMQVKTQGGGGGPLLPTEARFSCDDGREREREREREGMGWVGLVCRCWRRIPGFGSESLWPSAITTMTMMTLLL